ncbi:docking protein 2 [Sardina pilchardus]|uniref:docking protein 2 n=1 Tax=Sardina pilchardus TaxID=27697 RepID=UPI002E10F05F
MEEDIRKRGMLYLQQQRFGKKWKKVWTILYRESTCSISRLEFFECKDGMSTLEKPNRKQDNKKVIKLSDCIRVSEVDIEGCPRDCGPFLVETTEKLFIFAADNTEIEDWTQRLCEIAFPMKRGDRGAGPRRGSLPRVGDADGVSMENNSLYGERERGMKDFKVCARRSETADKCGLKGYYLMRTDLESLLLKDPRTGEVLYTWPYRFLRRFGRDKMTFSFEAGRRCQSGEGNFEFETKQGNEVFQAVEAAINLQRPTMPRRQTSGGVQEKETPAAAPPAVPTEDRRIYSTVDERQVGQAGQSRIGRSPPDGQPCCRLDAPAADKVLTGVKSLNIDSRPMPRKSQVKNFRSCPLAKSEEQTYSQITLGSMDHGTERSRSPGSLSADADADYSLPFDAIAKNVMADILQGSRHGGPPALTDQQQAGERDTAARQHEDRDHHHHHHDDGPDPLYDSIDEMAIGAAAIRIRTDSPKTYTRAEHIYDEPEGVALGPAKRAGSAELAQGSGSAASLYDDPEEVKGQAWRIMGEAGDPSGHEYPYNPNADDYAVPKPPRRAFKPPLDRELEDSRDNGLSPYDNVNVKKKN